MTPLLTSHLHDLMANRFNHPVALRDAHKPLSADGKRLHLLPANQCLHLADGVDRKLDLWLKRQA